MTVQIYNDDCLLQIPKINKTVDLVLVDLPYGQTACAWDSVIDLKQMWVELKKKCKRDCVYVFFCTTKFGYKLIQSNEKWFRYDIVWEKSRKVGFLSANKMPLRQHEMVYVFSDTGCDDLDNSRNLGLREYFKQVMTYTNKTLKEITKDCGRCAEHCFYINSTQFNLPTEKTYNKLIEVYDLGKMEGFRTIEDLQKEWGNPTYNPQKTEGKAYKTNGGGVTDSVYGEVQKIPIENKGDRHPTSILNIPEAPEEQEPRQHEMVYVFSDDENHDYNDLQNSRNLGLREYFKQVMTYTNKTLKEITKDCGRCAEHCFYINSTQFNLPTEKTYNKLIEVYDLGKMEGFRTIEDLQKEWGNPTYNPQKTEGKAYKTNGGGVTDSVYGEVQKIPIENKGDRHPTSILNIPEAPEEQEPRAHEMVYVFKEKQGTYNPQKTEGKAYKTKGEGNIAYYGAWSNKRIPCENKGDRHPTTIVKYPDDGCIGTNLYGGAPVIHKTDSRSNPHTPRHPTTIVKFNNPAKSIHRTQKPTDLCEWLVKSYSNEKDTVLDFCMGSGSTGIACLKNNRNFIGIEKDLVIFKVAKNRLIKHELETALLPIK